MRGQKRNAMLTFYDFPTEHWVHLRTTNPIESTFSTVKHRTRKTKESGSRVACLAVVHQLALSAQRKRRALNGAKLVADVIDGIPFVARVKKAA